MARPAKPTPTFECKQCRKTCEYKKYGVGHKWHYDRTQEFCSRDCANAFQTKGWGRDKNGYEVYYRSNGVKRVYVLRHRQVMEAHLGRKLHTHETVHHKDGNRANNEISNLELWSNRHGKGQRVEDKVEFCLSFLLEYPALLENLGYSLVEVSESKEESAQPQKVYESINVLLM